MLSALCLCLTCAIYQAYISFAYVLAVCYFLWELLENRFDSKGYLRWVAVQIGVYILALAAYYVIWQLCMKFQNITPTSYQGIDMSGGISADTLLTGAVNAVRTVVLFFAEWNFLRFGFTRNNAVNLLFCAFFAVGLLLAVVKSNCLKNRLRTVLMVLCLISIPFGTCAVCLVSPQVSYHALMLQSLCILYVFAAVIYDRWCGRAGADLMLALLCAVIINNSINANLTYTLTERSFHKTHALATQINTRIQLLDDGTIKSVLLIGDLDSFSGDFTDKNFELRDLGAWKGIPYTILNYRFIGLYTDFDLAYYRQQGLEFPLVEIGEQYPVPAGFELRFPLPDRETEQRLLESEAVQQMPIWPHRDSVQVVEDTIVIKLSEPIAMVAENQ